MVFLLHMKRHDTLAINSVPWSLPALFDFQISKNVEAYVLQLYVVWCTCSKVLTSTEPIATPTYHTALQHHFHRTQHMNTTTLRKFALVSVRCLCLCQCWLVVEERQLGMWKSSSFKASSQWSIVYYCYPWFSLIRYIPVIWNRAFLEHLHVISQPLVRNDNHIS